MQRHLLFEFSVVVDLVPYTRKEIVIERKCDKMQCVLFLSFTHSHTLNYFFIAITILEMNFFQIFCVSEHSYVNSNRKSQR